jgi:hypothetical protein
VAPPGGAAPLYQSGIKVERRPSRAGVPHSHRGTLHWQHTEKKSWMCEFLWAIGGAAARWTCGRSVQLKLNFAPGPGLHLWVGGLPAPPMLHRVPASPFSGMRV